VEKITTDLELLAPNTMTAIAAMPGPGNPDRDHLPDLDIMTVVMAVVAETEDIAPIGGVIAISRDQEAVKDPRLERLKEKEHSNISKLTKAVEMIIDSRTRRTNKDIKQP